MLHTVALPHLVFFVMQCFCVDIGCLLLGLSSINKSVIKMSWEAHSTHMLNTFGAGNCEYVGLFGKGDGVAWAESGSGSLKGKFQVLYSVEVYSVIASYLGNLFFCAFVSEALTIFARIYQVT